MTISRARLLPMMLIEAIDREAERALVGYPLDMEAEVEIAGTVTVGGGIWQQINVTGRTMRLERVGSRVVLHFE